MEQSTNITIVLFYIICHYKRLGHKSKKRQLLQDMQYCLQILKNMKARVDPNTSRKEVEHLINRLNQWGYQLEIQPVLKEFDCMDSEVIDIMVRLTEEIIQFCRKPFVWHIQTPVILRLFALHNFPRVLLMPNENYDPTASHIEKEEAISSALCYLKLQDKSQLL